MQTRAHAPPRSTHPPTPTQQAPPGTYLCTCTRNHACASTVCWRAGAGADGWDRRRTHLRCSTPHRPPAQTSQRARVEGRTTACRLAVRPSCLRGFPRRDRGFRASGGVLGRVRDGITFRTPLALGSWASDAAVLRPARRGSLHPQKERYPPPPLPLLPTLIPPDGPHVPPPALGSSARARRTSQRAAEPIPSPCERRSPFPNSAQRRHRPCSIRFDNICRAPPRYAISSSGRRAACGARVRADTTWLADTLAHTQASTGAERARLSACLRPRSHVEAKQSDPLQAQSGVLLVPIRVAGRRCSETRTARASARAHTHVCAPSDAVALPLVRAQRCVCVHESRVP